MLRKNKIIMFLFPLLMGTFVTTSCSSSNKLLLLNWGEYINDDLVLAFEKEFNCQVVISIADSNELFYSKLKSGTTVYDLIVPSDYMVKKMYENNLLQKIDYSRLTSYYEGMFLPGVYGIENEFCNNFGFEEYASYQVPYFWGTFGLMYNKRKAGVEEAVLRYGWDALFNKENLPKGAKTGMYNVPRDSYAACMFHHDLSPNLVGSEYLELVKKDLKNAKFDQWGTDELKKQVQKGDLDVAFMYTGDFLDMYYQEESEEVPYDIYIPNNTIAFMDSFVLTKNARHVDLAYEFMNYFLDVDNAMANASVVGYCTPLQESYNKIVSLKDSSYQGEKNWAQAMEKYYPLPKEDWPKPYQGTPLTNFDKDYLTKVTNLVNDVKTN